MLAERMSGSHRIIRTELGDSLSAQTYMADKIADGNLEIW
jgi:hypothetical protein